MMHIFVINTTIIITIIIIIITFIMSRIVNVTVITAGNSASIVSSTSIHTDINTFTIIVTTVPGTKQYTVNIRTCIMMNTGTKQCTIISFASFPSTTAKQKFGLASGVCPFTHMLIFSMVHFYMVRKHASWCPDIHRSKGPDSKNPNNQIPKNIRNSKTPKHPNIKNSKIPKFQNSKTPQNLSFFIFSDFLVLDFSIFGFDFWDFWICGSVDIWVARSALPRVEGPGVELHSYTCIYT